jgi:2C-methyl-D-erythritol 2,4-cyclodiphosphate synthase
MSGAIRIRQGFDARAFADGDDVTLGGVRIPCLGRLARVSA